MSTFMTLLHRQLPPHLGGVHQRSAYPQGDPWAPSSSPPSTGTKPRTSRFGPPSWGGGFRRADPGFPSCGRGWRGRAAR